jgi:hypothetical protein
MDSLNWFVAEAAMQERRRELDAITNAQTPAAARASHGIRHMLASTFVRAGLRLDPAAGEGLSAFDMRTAGQEGGC